MNAGSYNPFDDGPFRVGVHTLRLPDSARRREFPCEIWYPVDGGALDRLVGLVELREAVPFPGPHPLILYSHSSGGHRRTASFLCRHLASHGYLVAAMDHSEVVAPELAARTGETRQEQQRRIDAVVASRVPDIRFLLDSLLDGRAGDIGVDDSRIGLAGHSFGGWTVLATPETEPRVQSVVAMGPGGSSRPRPGILPLPLTFNWDRDVPTLYLAAENDVPIPLDRVIELFGRTPGSKRMVILRRADHQHFIDDVEREHEAIRAMTLPGEAAWIPAAMRPIDQLCSREEAHLFVRGLTLAHLDATLRRIDAAKRILSGDLEGTLAARGVEAIAFRA